MNNQDAPVRMQVVVGWLKSVCKGASKKEKEGKEWGFEAPARRICLAAVSFRMVEDYGRITANE